MSKKTKAMRIVAAVMAVAVVAGIGAVQVRALDLGNLLGIGSFIAYGLLCTVVGYFAPAPPRAATTEGDATGEPA